MPAPIADLYQGFQSIWEPGASAPSNAPPGAHWDPTYAMYVPDEQVAPVQQAPPQQLPPPGPDLSQQYQGSQGTFQPPPQQPLPQVPGYTPPAYTPPPAFAYPEFQAPDAQAVLSRPGYAFRQKEGERIIQNDRAHRGLLNTGSTLRDLVNYGQDYATNEYGNEWNRSANEYGLNRANAVGIYNTNYQTQYQDPYQIARQGAQDVFAPKMAGYQNEVAATQRGNELDWTHAFDLANFDWNKYRDWRDSTWNMNYQYATA
jgi:hypothetical protein